MESPESDHVYMGLWFIGNGFTPLEQRPWNKRSLTIAYWFGEKKTENIVFFFIHQQHGFPMDYQNTILSNF